jgi:sugar phosphate isomerase/epimerase
MKYCFMTFSCPELEWERVLATAKRFGYDGVEPRAQAKHAHGVETTATAEERAAIRQQAAEAGVAIACLATSCRYTAADKGELEQMMEQSRALIALAGDIGAPCMRVFGGSIPAGMSREDATAQVADCLAALAEDAAAANVVLCAETHDSWCDANDLARVIERVDHPNVQVNWDIMHPYRAGMAIDEAFAALEPYIRHIHFHDGKPKEEGGGLCPIGEGFVDHRRAVELLAGIGYTGHLSGEWINWEPWEAHLPRELATMRGYEA